jgi:hypothetical protein
MNTPQKRRFLEVMTVQSLVTLHQASLSHTDSLGQKQTRPADPLQVTVFSIILQSEVVVVFIFVVTPRYLLCTNCVEIGGHTITNLSRLTVNMRFISATGSDSCT